MISVDRACQAQDLGAAEMSFEPGHILTPGYELGEDYPQNAHCEWVIGASKADVSKCAIRNSKSFDKRC